MDYYNVIDISKAKDSLSTKKYFCTLGRTPARARAVASAFTQAGISVTDALRLLEQGHTTIEEILGVIRPTATPTPTR